MITSLTAAALKDSPKVTVEQYFDAIFPEIQKRHQLGYTTWYSNNNTINSHLWVGLDSNLKQSYLKKMGYVVSFGEYNTIIRW